MFSWSDHTTTQQIHAEWATDGIRDRNSDIRLEPSEIHAVQPRFSDYEYSPDLDAERSSTGIVYDQADVRVSASSDRLLRRGRVNARSDDRLSSIYGGNLTSWASDRLLNGLSRFSIPEEFEVQNQEMLANATAMKLAALSTVNSSIALEDVRKYRRPGSDEPQSGTQSPMPADLQSPGIAVHDTTMANDPGQNPNYDRKSEVGKSHSLGDHFPSSNSQNEPSTPTAQPQSIVTAEFDERATASQTKEAASPEVILQSFRVSIEEPCYKVLPTALKNYNISADSWNQYAICIDYTKGGQKHERPLYPDDKPLALFKEMQRKGVNPQIMLRKSNNAPFYVIAPNRLQGRSSATPLDTTEPQCVVTPWTTEVSSPSLEHTIDFTKVLWHAVSISRLAEGHRKSTRYLPYEAGDILDVVADNGLASYTWVARLHGSASKKTGWIISSDFLKVRLPSEHAEYARSRISTASGYCSLTLDTVRVYSDQHLQHESAWWKVSTLLIIGRLKHPDHADNLAFRAIGHHGTECYLPLQLAVYPKIERQDVLQCLILYAEEILKWIEIVQGKDIRDEWSGLGTRLRGVSWNAWNAG